MWIDLEIRIASCPPVWSLTGDATTVALWFVFVSAPGEAQRNTRNLYWHVPFRCLRSADRPGTLQKRRAGTGTTSKKRCSEELKETAVTWRGYSTPGTFPEQKATRKVGTGSLKTCVTASFSAMFHHETERQYHTWQKNASFQRLTAEHAASVRDIRVNPGMNSCLPQLTREQHMLIQCF